MNDDLIIGNSKQVNLSNAKIDDCNFHESVNTTEFDINRTLKINPPDGNNQYYLYKILKIMIIKIKATKYLNNDILLMKIGEFTVMNYRI